MTTQGYERGQYRPERLPQAAEQTVGEGSLRTALAIVRGVHEAVAATGQTEPTTADERWEIHQIIRPWEKEALLQWAVISDEILDEHEFTQNWLAYGEVEGGEHQIYQNEGYFLKRNNLLYHTNWLEYFHRIVLHNWLFPETSIHFEGLMLVDDELQPVITQKAFLATRGANRNEVEAEMERRGFYRRKADNYYNPDLGVLVEDLHDENVLVSPKGSLLIFDPVIYLAKPEMGLSVPIGFY